jgi:hypothetical protein
MHLLLREPWNLDLIQVLLIRLEILNPKSQKIQNLVSNHPDLLDPRLQKWTMLRNLVAALSIPPFSLSYPGRGLSIPFEVPQPASRAKQHFQRGIISRLCRTITPIIYCGHNIRVTQNCGANIQLPPQGFQLSRKLKKMAQHKLSSLAYSISMSQIARV